MKQMLYTKDMSPVKYGDTVKFSSRSWTVDEVCDDGYVWVRSNDEQHQIVKVIALTIGANRYEVR